MHESALVSIQNVSTEHSGKMEGIKESSRLFFMGCGVFIVGLLYPYTIHSFLFVPAIAVIMSTLSFFIGIFVYTK